MKKIDSNLFKLAGVVVGVLFVIMGIVTLVEGLGGDTYYAGSAPYTYDSGYAAFGADFYSYVCNNSAEAASAARAAANGVRELTILVKNVSGIAFIGFGLLSICFFGSTLKMPIKKEKISLAVADTAPAEVVAAPVEADVASTEVVAATAEAVVTETAE